MPMKIIKEKSFSYWLLFIIWPFASFLLALTKFNRQWAVNILWGFIAYFGFTIVTASPTADMVRISESLREFHNSNISFAVVLDMIYHESTNYVDFVQPLLTFFVSLFTDNGRVLYLVFSLIFGYFYSRNVVYIFNNMGASKSLIIKMLFVIAAIIIPYWYVQGFRFWTSSQIFLYGLLPILIENKRKSIIWVLLTPLVHFSFLIPALIVLFYWLKLIPIKLNILFILFLISLFFGELELTQVRHNLLQISPDAYQDRITQYIDEDVYMRKTEKISQKAWHARLYGPALRYALIITLSILFFKRIKRKKFLAQNHQLKLFLAFVLIYMIFANFATNIPSGGRFMTPGLFLITAFLLVAAKNIPIRHMLIKTVRSLAPLFLLYLIVQIRTGFDFHSVLTVLGNPITGLFFEPGMPLIDLIK